MQRRCSDMIRAHFDPLTRFMRGMLVVLSLLVCVPVTHAAEGFVQTLRDSYGADAAARGHQLGLLINRLRFEPLTEQLRRINHYFNAFRYRSDRKLWGREDYWASPVEFIGQFAGDCEDYAIGKYFALRWLGVARESMQVTYVHNSDLNRYHVVLQVSVGNGAEPVILDSLNPHVLPASQRHDLAKIVGFGEVQVTLALAGGGERIFARKGRWLMSEWEGVLVRTSTEPKPDQHDLFVRAVRYTRHDLQLPNQHLY